MSRSWWKRREGGRGRREGRSWKSEGIVTERKRDTLELREDRRSIKKGKGRMEEENEKGVR